MMGEELITIAFDAASLGNIAKLEKFQSFLEPAMADGLVEVGKLVVQAAVANTWAVFANPNGELADTIKVLVNGPLAIEVGTDSPYGARREFGFSGKTDSRGRTYVNDPGKPYMEPALTDNEDQIASIMNLAVAEAMAAMGVQV